MANKKRRNQSFSSYFPAAAPAQNNAPATASFYYGIKIFYVATLFSPLKGQGGSQYRAGVM
jgi:hypothetical protein